MLQIFEGISTPRRSAMLFPCVMALAVIRRGVFRMRAALKITGFRGSVFPYFHAPWCAKRIGSACCLFALACFVLAGLTGCRDSREEANSLVGSPFGAREVSFKTLDGWGIFADLYAPSGTSKGVVILLHERNGAASDWTPLAKALQSAGYMALAIDQRGAGRSVQGPGGVGGKGDNAPWETGGDIAAAINFTAEKGPVGIVGASYGANNALIYAAAHPDQVKSLVLFSPGANYNGLDAVTAGKSWRGPMEIFHDSADTIAGDGPKTIDQSTPSSDHKLVVLNGSKHGTDLLRDALSDTTDSPVAFLQRTLK